MAALAYTVRDSARLIGVNQLTVRRWIMRGWVSHYRLGGLLIRIPTEEIERIIRIRNTVAREIISSGHASEHIPPTKLMVAMRAAHRLHFPNQ